MSFRVLVVDDSVVYRRILTQTVETIAGVTEVKFASSGQRALEVLAQPETFNLILLDVEMPELDGVETLKRIKEDHASVEVVMISSVNERGAAKVMQSLSLGALEFIQKPNEKDQSENQKILKESLEKVFQAVSTYNGAATQTKQRPVSKREYPNNLKIPPLSFQLVTIGVSTGGPDALSKIIPHLPGDFPLPIVLVQHMPALFTQELAKSLDRKSELAVVEASEGVMIEGGTVYIAPGGKHMEVSEENNQLKVLLTMDPPENSCRPAVDVLFRSISYLKGYPNILSLVLTGMGSDGKLGVEELKKNKNTWTLTQSEKSCVVYGMPRAVDEAGLTDEQLELDDFPKRLAELVRNGSYL